MACLQSFAILWKRRRSVLSASISAIAFSMARTMGRGSFFELAPMGLARTDSLSTAASSRSGKGCTPRPFGRLLSRLCSPAKAPCSCRDGCP